jgi:hypothetical protein
MRRRSPALTIAGMSYAKKIHGPHDPKKIDLNHDWELDYWTRELGVTEVELREAIRSVGSNDTERVRKHLMGARPEQIIDRSA